jgi:hypothetical protein
MTSQELKTDDAHSSDSMAAIDSSSGLGADYWLEERLLQCLAWSHMMVSEFRERLISLIGQYVIRIPAEALKKGVISEHNHHDPVIR